MLKWTSHWTHGLAALALVGCSQAAATGTGTTTASDTTSDATSDVTAGDDTCTTDECTAPATLTYPIVSTSQALCFGVQDAMKCPSAGAAFFGQDAQFPGQTPSYTKSSDGLTVHDNVTGLTWQQSPDTNVDGVINASDKLTWTQIQARPAALNAAKFGGYSDWRVPSIKELYSLMSFNGTDPSGESGNDTSGLTPFIDTTYFAFGYGDTTAGERVIDAQFGSSTLYVSTTMLSEPTLFGVNFADGRNKG